MARLKGKGHNLVDPEMKRLFIIHRDKYATLKKALDGAQNNLKKFGKTIKSDGFSMQQIKDAVQLSTPAGEAEFKLEIANRLLAAAYSDADIGDQLSLFLEEGRTPAVDRAYKKGQTRAAENKTLETNEYAPGTDQYQAFCDGYHAEQERQVKGGIKKLEAKEPAKGANGKGKGAKAVKAAKGGKRGPGRPPKAAAPAKAPKDEAPPRRPTAVPATRASVAAGKAANPQADAESYFSKSEPAGNA